MKNISTDRKYLDKQYATDRNLAIRIKTHELYTVPKVEWVMWVQDQAGLQGFETLIDVGCGSGVYIASTAPKVGCYIAGDISFGMVAGLELPHPPRVNLDAQVLPFADDSADIIFANHMIYHIPDKFKAVAEFARVLKPNGKLVAATNSTTTMQESAHVLAVAFDKLHGVEGAAENIYREYKRVDSPFTLEGGAPFLESAFSSVKRVDLETALVFHDPKPFVEYIETARERHSIALQTIGKTWEDFAPVLIATVQEIIDAEGAFRVSKLSGVFIAANDS